jgi:MoaA/NifB/PqqE/SkfB family radical SAM enzyme
MTENQFFAGPFRSASENVFVDIDILLELDWAFTKTYNYSKLYYRTDDDSFSEDRVVCFRVRKRNAIERLRLLLPINIKRSNQIFLRLDALPYSRGRAAVSRLVVPDANSEEEAMSRMAVVNAWKQETRRRVDESEHKKSSELTHYPESISLELTARCNLTCTHCSSHGVDALHRHHNRMPVYSRQQLKALAEETFPYLTSICLVGRGEPTFVPNDLWNDLFKHAQRFNVLINLVTNGLMLRQRIEAHHLPWIDTITFSIDGSTDATMARNRGGVALRDVVDSVRYYHELRQTVEVARRPKLSLSYTLKRNNIAEFPDFIEQMAVFEPDLIYARHLLIFHEKNRSESLLDDPQHANAHLAKAYSAMARLGIPGDCPPIIGATINDANESPLAVGGEQSEADRRLQRSSKDSSSHTERHRQREEAWLAIDESWQDPSTPEMALPDWHQRADVGGAETDLPATDRCVYFHRSAVLMADGQMVTCARPYAETVGQLGEETRLWDLWNGAALNSCRSAFGTANEWTQCRQCWYRESHYAGQRDARSANDSYDLENTLSRYDIKSWDFRTELDTSGVLRSDLKK